MHNLDLAYDSELFWQSPFGAIYLGSKNGKLARLAFSPIHFTLERENPSCQTLGQGVLWLEAYFKGARPAPDELPLFLQGTPFQLQCWQALANVPYGETVSYGELAACVPLAGHKKYARALGHAMVRNPVWIVLPCHRVLHADGSPGGYAGGVALKQRLLAHEKKP